MKRMCPIIVGRSNAFVYECKENQCKLWVPVYTTDNMQVQMCAFEAMAMKNSDGKIVI